MPGSNRIELYYVLVILITYNIVLR